MKTKWETIHSDETSETQVMLTCSGVGYHTIIHRIDYTCDYDGSNKRACSSMTVIPGNYHNWE